jgi:hypothetical protein
LLNQKPRLPAGASGVLPRRRQTQDRRQLAAHLDAQTAALGDQNNRLDEAADEFARRTSVAGAERGMQFGDLAPVGFRDVRMQPRRRRRGRRRWAVLSIHGFARSGGDARMRGRQVSRVHF